MKRRIGQRCRGYRFKMQTAAWRGQANKIHHKGGRRVMRQIIAKKRQRAVGGPEDVHAGVHSVEDRVVSSFDALPAAISGSIRLIRRRGETGPLCGGEPILASKVEVRRLHDVALRDGVGVLKGRRRTRCHPFRFFCSCSRSGEGEKESDKQDEHDRGCFSRNQLHARFTPYESKEAKADTVPCGFSRLKGVDRSAPYMQRLWV